MHWLLNNLATHNQSERFVQFRLSYLKNDTAETLHENSEVKVVTEI